MEKVIAKVAKAITLPDVKAAFDLIMLATDAGSTETVADVWNAWAAANRDRVRAFLSDSGRAKRLLAFFGERQAASITLEDVDRYRRHRANQTTVRKGPPAPKTRNNEVELLRRILHFAVERKLLRSNPIATVRMEPEDNIRQVVIKPDVLHRILAAAKPLLRAFVLVAYDSGMRRREIVNLRWSQVDRERGLIDLAATDTKTRHARTTILSARALKALAALPQHPTFVFVNSETGKTFHHDYMTELFVDTCRDAGISAPGGGNVWIHDLRRSFVTLARRNGVEESVVMQLTGHKTHSVFRRYNIVGLEDVLRARAKLEKAARRANKDSAKGGLRGDDPTGSCEPVLQ